MKKSQEEKPTYELENILKKIKEPEAAEKFVRENTVGVYASFREYFNDYIAKHKLTISEIKTKSGISRNYIYNILNGDRNPGRDKILALCIAAGMNFSETNKALRIAGEGILYPKNERDARIVIAVNNGITNIIEINLLLEESGLEIIK